MSTGAKLIAAELESVLKRKDEAIKARTMHTQKADDYDQVAHLLAEAEANLVRDLDAVRHACAPQIRSDERCEERLMDGRNEIRCWGKRGHKGPCT